MKFIPLYFLLFLYGCTPQKNVIAQSDPRPLAFKGAEGYGKYTTGGRGGKVFIVSNLNDEGAGSLREAVESKEPAFVVFAISGTIHLQSRLVIRSNKTIAGQTAPGDGICIADHPVQLGGDNIIVRYLRFRMGDRYQSEKGMVDGSGSDDAFGGIGRKNIIIDHCSMSWSTDEAFTVYNGDSTTLQWNIISEPLNYSYHFETGDKDWENHGYGGIWGGRHLTAHHNLFAHCLSRNPRFAGIRSVGSELVDYRNNVIYNWGNNNVYGGEGGKYNIVNNYYKYGPSTNPRVRFRIVNPSKQENPLIPYGKYYVAGNFVDGSDEVTKNNDLGVHLTDGQSEVKKDVLIKDPHAVFLTWTQKPEYAYELVLKSAGASLPMRDSLDERIINDVINRTGRIIDVQGGYKHGTPYELSRSAWPALGSLPPNNDRDGDGMPDSWEIEKGLNPDKNDAMDYKLDKVVPNIEVYVEELTEELLRG